MTRRYSQLKVMLEEAHCTGFEVAGPAKGDFAATIVLSRDTWSGKREGREKEDFFLCSYGSHLQVCKAF